ncbi:hypothetical protein COT29_01430 [Candidatus Micrarchaeota archaeon CG08_land_8_20_14_0_20_59_11]|nr:MAG: hypothetical protein COT29_01430 [Candidatus Micrarchaeota archaeon CG08_land_8_20_14_0_20_59_11]
MSEDIVKVVGTLFLGIVALMFVGLLLQVGNALTCANEKAIIAQQQNEIATLKAQNDNLQGRLGDCRAENEQLMTKRDFENLKQEVQNVEMQINNTRNEISVLNTNLVNNITVVQVTFAIGIGIVLFELFEFGTLTFFGYDLNLKRKLSSRVRKWLGKEKKE